MSKSANQKKPVSSLWMIPVILMIGFVPLIVHTYEYKTGLSQFDWFPNPSESQVDVFFAWKMIAVIVLGAVMLGIILFRHFYKKEQLRFDNAFYLVFFYALFVAMSAVFSPYKYWVLGGTYELFEPIWVVFGYIILCYYTYHSVRETRHVTAVLRWAGVGMLLVAFIGAFQYAESDFFKTTFGKHLITSPDYWDNLDGISFVMGSNTSYTTLYNPNYLSFYFGMLIPLCVCLFIASKKVLHKILTVLVLILSVMCMAGSHSDSGWMALVAAVCIVILILMNRTKLSRIIAVAAVGIGIAALFVLCTKTPLGTRLSTTITGTYHMEERFFLRGIEANSDYAALDIGGNKLLLSYSINEADGQTTIVTTDANGTPLTRTCIDEANLIDQIDDPLYSGCLIQPVVLGEMPAIRAQIQGASWDFVYLQDEGYYYANSAGKLTRPEPVKSSNRFREDAMSGRGHIWNLTMPLLGKHIFVGVGANAYMLAYPQDDYIYHAYVSGANNYDVKAHCWYLQQWVENGLFGTLLLLGFIGWYLVRCARIYRRASLRDSLTWVGIGLFTAVFVYIVAAIANDSNVCTAPVFWGFLGLGMAVNRLIVEKQGLFTADSTESAENIEKSASTVSGTAFKASGSRSAGSIESADNEPIDAYKSPNSKSITHKSADSRPADTTKSADDKSDGKLNPADRKPDDIPKSVDSKSDDILKSADDKLADTHKQANSTPSDRTFEMDAPASTNNGISSPTAKAAGKKKTGKKKARGKH